MHRLGQSCECRLCVAERCSKRFSDRCRQSVSTDTCPHPTTERSFQPGGSGGSEEGTGVHRSSAMGVKGVAVRTEHSM
jgi:hypothetical protein